MEIKRIGPYLIDHKIGSGGMGTVYLAQHAETGDDVAVKVLPPALAREEGFVARFEREIESLQRLINPNIVRLLDSGVADNMYFYAMEYVEGETLSDRLRRVKRLHWRDVVNFSLQICSALKSAHDAGIVHRDLKPSNLLIDKDNNIKLTDFGVAQVFAAGRLTVEGGIIGTAEYMSPEQANGRRATKKSDLYSLGAVMFTMLTGRPPFVEKTILEVIQKHKHGTFDRPSRFVEGIPRRLEETVCQLLEKDPDKRFPDALVLSRRLQEILRRAEIASQQETRVADVNSTSKQNTPEVRITEDEPADQDIGGTLMRDLVKADIEQSAAGSPFSRIFDNTWVLLGLFVLLVGGGIAWFRSIDHSPEAETTVEGRPKELNNLRDAKSKIENYLKRHPLDATDHLLRQAHAALEAGDVVRAERLLADVQKYFALHGQNEKWKDTELVKVMEHIDNIKKVRKDVGNSKEMATYLLRLGDEMKSKGNLNEARQYWRMVLAYGNHASCEEEVEEAKRLLNQPSGRRKPGGGPHQDGRAFSSVND